MIRHCVFLNLAKGGAVGPLAQVMEGLQALVDELDGCDGFHHGPNRDYEGKSQDYAYGFVFDATDQRALLRYAEDPTHRALGARLAALCVGGAEGIVVFDIDTGLA